MVKADLNERQQRILRQVRQQGFVAIEALAQQFDVTSQTIRRDINELCGLSLLQRYHGGAGLPSSVENLAYDTRQIIAFDEKQRIARCLAAEIPDHASLCINIGTTTEAVAKALLDHAGLRVITNNLNVANTLSGNPDFEVIVTGGVVRSRDRGIIGAAAIDSIKQFKVDFAVIGISGIDDDGTLLDFDYREVRVAQAILGIARRTYLVADHDKFGRNAMVRLGHLRDIDAIFTDRPVPEKMLSVFEAAEVDVFVAEPDAP